MIISVSRRTDIPRYYADWFFNRIKAGFVYTRNPMNFRQVSRIALTPEAVSGLVFWSKNPAPMAERLHELNEYRYYFQCTLTPYGTDIEPHVPQKSTEVIATFKKMAAIVGADNIIWRYDPILLNPRYTIEYHLHAFEKIAAALQGYTRRVVISFLDTSYKETKRNQQKLNLLPMPFDVQQSLAAALAAIAHRYHFTIAACAETMDWSALGITRARCIDGRMFGLDAPKDKNQRAQCGCAASVDIGLYNTCLHGCLYCYANYNAVAVARHFAAHDPASPLLFGEITPDDKITERKIKK